MPSRRKAFGALALAGIGVAALNAMLRSAASRREDLDLTSVEAPGRWVDIDGRRVHHVDTGAGEPIVLIHGWNASTFSMRRVIPELAQRFRVIAIDLPGYGLSSRDPEADYSMTAQAAVVRELLDRLGVERVALLGHSMGGGVAMRLAASAPERIERLVLVSSVTPEEARRARFAHLFRPLMPLIGYAFVRRNVVERALRRVVHDPAIVTQELVDGYFRPLRVKGHLRSQMKAMSDRRRDAALDPRAVRQPVLLLWGEHDRVIPPAAGLELAEALPNARFASIRGAGHLALEEQPAECARLLEQFLGQPADAAIAPSGNGVSPGRPSTVS